MYITIHSWTVSCDIVYPKTKEKWKKKNTKKRCKVMRRKIEKSFSCVIESNGISVSVNKNVWVCLMAT